MEVRFAKVNSDNEILIVDGKNNLWIVETCNPPLEKKFLGLWDEEIGRSRNEE